MAIGSYQLSERFAIQPESVFSFKFNAANTDAAVISVNGVTGFILYINV